MPELSRIEGPAAPLPIENLDTDQIMPKQFLLGLDKANLDRGLFHGLRFDTAGRPIPDFILNKPGYAGAAILIGGTNFGCGSSREHAVWGLYQYGFRAVIAPSFAEIFHANAINNRLLPVALPDADVERLMADAGDPAHNRVEIDLNAMTVASFSGRVPFTLSARHRRMFMEGLDVIGFCSSYKPQLAEFLSRHWSAQPWLRDISIRTAERLRKQDDAGMEKGKTA